LALGDKAPDAALTTVDGKIVQLASLYKDGPIVLTFYRGGWCPICNRALLAWQDKLDDLKEAGGTFVALSPEKPDHASKTIERGHLSYTVLSDPKFEAAKAFRVHFAVDEGTKAKYKQFGMNVAEANASGTWELPAPATFVIDRKGVVRYVFADWDYKKRADPGEVVAAVRAISNGK
jgi:peroxiredoxin